MTGLTVTINVTQDIFVPLGLSFQLNAYSAQGENCVYQQYILGFAINPGGNPTIRWGIDNWPSAAYSLELQIPPGDNFLNVQGQLFAMSSSEPTLPAGYSLTIALANDASGNVTGATFSVNDGHGHTPGTGLIPIIGQSVYDSPTGAKVDSSGVAPIHAFELNVVGAGNGEVTLLRAAGGRSPTRRRALSPCRTPFPPASRPPAR